MNQSKSLARIVSIGLPILFFLSYLIPEWATALTNPLNFYSNAWDESNYLTHQMAIYLRFTPSYWFGENIYLWLENLGLSGSWQNILFDTILPPAIVWTTAFSLKKIFPVSMTDALIYALLIWFSSVLFSFTNPLISHLFSHNFPNEKSWIVPAVYSFPSILRTPNPQISYFLICISIGLYLNFKKWYFLLIPLPFLYFPVFLGYVYVLITGYFFNHPATRNLSGRVLFANIGSSLSVIFLMMLLINLSSVKEMIVFSTLTNASAYLISQSHQAQIPVIFLFFLIPTPFLIHYRSKIDERLWFYYWSLLIGLLVCSNTQIVTGILFAPKVFQSDSAVIAAGILLAILFYLLDTHLSRYRYFKILCLLPILIAVLASQGFSFKHWSFIIKKYPELSDRQKTMLINHSPFVLITGPDADFYAQFLPYAIPKMYSPLQSIHYTYLPFIFSCEHLSSMFNQAIFEAKNIQDKKLLMSLERNYQMNLLINQKLQVHFKNLEYCQQNSQIEFERIDIPEKNKFKYLSNN